MNSLSRIPLCMIAVGKKHILEAFRRNKYMAAGCRESDCSMNLWNLDIAEELIESLNCGTFRKQHDTLERVNLQHSSRKSSYFLRKLGGSSISPIQYAGHIPNTSRATSVNEHSRHDTKSGISNLKETLNSNYLLGSLKLGKTPSFDSMHNEFLINSGSEIRN